jgi:vacuolar-type H+-ATPase subunit D/Vma8
MSEPTLEERVTALENKLTTLENKQDQIIAKARKIIKRLNRYRKLLRYRDDPNLYPEEEFSEDDLDEL